MAARDTSVTTDLLITSQLIYTGGADLTGVVLVPRTNSTQITIYDSLTLGNLVMFRQNIVNKNNGSQYYPILSLPRALFGIFVEIEGADSEYIIHYRP